MAAPFALRARRVYPVDRPLIDGGIVTIADGRIVAVGENASALPPRDLGDVALIPGLINAHTHLEFSLLRLPLGQPHTAFADWIGNVIDYRRQQPVVDDTAILAGVAESRAAGVAALGEIATRAWPRGISSSLADLPVVVFRELLGLAKERVAELEQLAIDHLAEQTGQAGGLSYGGLSPHAPYTVHPALLQMACELSRQRRVPLAMHLAESREELELLRTHSGPLVSLLQSLGAWHPAALPRPARPLDYLRTLATAHHALVIHGNYLAADEIAFAAASRQRLSLVYCPRTHAYFGHEPYPLAAMLAAGVRVAVGTDSRASNPDLNVWAELQHIAAHHPAIEPEEILRMGTLAGAEALGLARQLGSITPGKLARLAVVPMDSDPGRGWFSSPSVQPLNP